MRQHLLLDCRLRSHLHVSTYQARARYLERKCWSLPACQDLPARGGTHQAPGHRCGFCHTARGVHRHGRMRQQHECHSIKGNVLLAVEQFAARQPLSNAHRRSRRANSEAHLAPAVSSALASNHGCNNHPTAALTARPPPGSHTHCTQALNAWLALCPLTEAKMAR